MKIIEISSQQTNTGEKQFRAVLFKIQPDSCLVDLTGTQYNLNGITWIRKYCEMALPSAIGKSVTVEFINDERTEILGHGDTGVEDNIPVFNNATVLGHITNAYIAEMELDGECCTVCMAEGILDYMRYKPFLDILETKLNNGETIYGSVEIIGCPENDNEIIYLDGWKAEGRVPVDFLISGWAILDVKPSDNKSQLLELNQQEKKEEKSNMDEKELKALIVSTITETNSVKADYETKLSELNSQIETKDAEIKELNESKETMETNATEKDQQIADLTAKNAALQKELDACQTKELNAALDEKLATYTDEQKACVESEINAYKENPMAGDAEAIVSKICVSIVAKQKEEEKIAEINSAKEKNEDNDIFSEMNDAKGHEEKDDNIF